MARKKKFQNGGRASPYNPMLHMTNPAEAERQRIAGNKAARKRRMPTQEQDDYWWSGLTRPVDEVLRKSLGPAASSTQGVLDLFTPARSIAEAANKPTAGNIIDAATDTALTAPLVKAVLTPTKAAQKVKRTIPKKPGGDDMSKYKVAKSLFGLGKSGTKKTSKSKPTRAEKVAAENKRAREAGFRPHIERLRPKSSSSAAPKPKKTSTTKPKKASTTKPDIIAHVGSRNTVATNRANRAAKKASTPKTATSPTSAPMPKKPVTPKVNKPTTSAKTSKKSTSGKSTPKRVVDIAKTAAGRGTPGRRSKVDQTVSKVEEKLGLGKKGQRRGVSKRDQKIAKNVRTGAKGLGKAALIGGGVYGGTKLYDTLSDKDAVASKPTKATKSKVKAPYGPDYSMDMDDFDSAKPVPSKPPKPAATPKKDPDFEYYGKEGTGLGDFSRKHGIQYATDKGYKKWFDTHDGEKKGGRPGKGKMKTQGMNRSKRTGFSGRGSGVALRGF